MGRLEGKVALVTGAARGTGEATARWLVEEGVCVALADLLDDQGEAVAKQLDEAVLELGRWGIRVNAVCPQAGSAEMIAPYIHRGHNRARSAGRLAVNPGGVLQPGRN